MKVLYISYDGMTDPLGQSQVIPYLQGLSQKGHDVTIISAEKKENYQTNVDYISTLLTKSDINWHTIFYKKHPPILSTVIDVFRIYKLAKKINRSCKFQIVHCRSYIPMLVGMKLKRISKAKLVFDMRGFWADERLEGGIWRASNILFKLIYDFFKRQEKSFLRNADAIVVLTHKAKEIIEDWRIAPKNTVISIIPCCVDTCHFLNKSTYGVGFRKKVDVKRHNLVLSYIGSLGTWYMVDEMLDFFRLLLKSKPNAVFLFVTKDNPEIIYSKLSKYQIDRSKIRIYGTDRKELPAIISISDISIFFIRPSFSKQGSSPTKQAELLSMGIPIIANSGVGDNDLFFKENTEIGKLVNTFNHVEFERIIQMIPEMKSSNEENIRKVAIEHFELENGVNTYNDIYINLSK